MEVILVAARSARDEFMPPLLYTSSTKCQDFIDMTLNVPNCDLAPRLEGFLLSGLKGEVAIDQTNAHSRLSLITDRICRTVCRVAHRNEEAGDTIN